MQRYLILVNIDTTARYTTYVVLAGIKNPKSFVGFAGTAMITAPTTKRKFALF